MNDPRIVHAARVDEDAQYESGLRPRTLRDYIGQERVRVMPYDPRAPHHERYLRNPPTYDPALIARVERDALTLCRALGYDLNTVEFAVEDGVPYAIDFMNPAPDADRRSVGDANFAWVVEAVADLAIHQATTPAPPRVYRWDTLLRG